MSGAGHYGTTPATVCDAILAGLSVLQHRTIAGVESGCVRSIGRIESDEVEAVSRGLASGLPALLLVYGGSTFSVASTHGQRFDVEMSLRIYVAAGSLRSVAKRLTSGDATPTSATAPGLEELLDWATYYACRAAAAVAGVRRVYPKKHATAGTIEAGKFVGYVDLAASRQVDLYDDALAGQLATLGLVAEPIDPAALWTDETVDPPHAGTLPNITDPPTKQGGVVTL